VSIEAYPGPGAKEACSGALRLKGFMETFLLNTFQGSRLCLYVSNVVAITVAPIRGIYLQLKQCYSAHDYFTLKINDSAFLVFTFQFLYDFSFKFPSFFFTKMINLRLKFHSLTIVFFKLLSRLFTSGPIGRAGRP
jgi:hypothetical protein